MADGSGIYNVHSDRLDTPRFLTDASQQLVWRQILEAYGGATVNEDVDGDLAVVEFNIRFPGQYYDKETSLHYNNFRYYDPETGRYISTDSIGLLGRLDRRIVTGIDGGSNLYSYGINNPLKYVDHNGKWITIVAWITVVAIPAGITYIVVDCIDKCKKEKGCPPPGQSTMSIASECAERCTPFLDFLGFNTPKSIPITGGKKLGEAAGEAMSE
jgi:RHS repeat-associated protein